MEKGIAILHQLSEALKSEDRTSLRTFVHQTRNASAFHNLAEQLPHDTNPSRMLHLASGSHVAPLAVCDALLDATPYSLRLLELFESEEVKTLLAACLCTLPEDGQSAPWTQRYKVILDCLSETP